MSKSEDQDINVWPRFLTALQWFCSPLESFMDGRGQIRKQDLFLEICPLAGFRHVGHGQRCQGTARGAGPRERGREPVAAMAPAGKALSCSVHWGGQGTVTTAVRGSEIARWAHQDKAGPQVSRGWRTQVALGTLTAGLWRWVIQT